MPVCKECETSIDDFLILADQLYTNIHHYPIAPSRNINDTDIRQKVKNVTNVLTTLQNNLFSEYGEIGRKFQETLQQYSREHSIYYSREQTRYTLEVLAFLGDAQSYKRLLARLVSEKVGTQSGQGWILDSKFINSAVQSMQVSDEDQQDMMKKLLLRHLNRQHHRLADVERMIRKVSATYTGFVEPGHVASLEEENSQTNDPMKAPGIREISHFTLREVQEYCPACGSLEWQGLYVKCREQEIEFEGRITDITDKYIPDLVRGAQRKLTELQRRISTYEKFRDGAEKKVDARIKRRKTAAKKAEIATLEAQIKKLKEE
jgi:hypothetical protein